MAVRSSIHWSNQYGRGSSFLRNFFSSYPFSHTLLFLSILACLCIQPSNALRNVTVDDKDPRIAYRGSWERTPNYEEYSAGGGHMTTFNDPGASASFTFKGTAVYLSYPLWPYKVSSGWISLDGEPPLRVSLQDPNHSESDGGRATAPSSIQYFANNLDPGVEHSLVVSAVDTDAFIVFDSATYTEVEPSDDPIQRTTPSSATVPTAAVSPSSTNSSASSKQSSTRIVTIAVCIVVALLILLSIPLIIFLCKRRRGKKERDHWRQEAFQGWNAAYGSSEPKSLDPPIYTAHSNSNFPRTPSALASSESVGTMSYVVTTPPPAPTAAYNLAPQDERYFDQMRAAHSHMMAAKSSMGSLVVPVSPPPPAATAQGRDVQRSQTRGVENEMAAPPARQYRSLRAKRQYSNDSIATARLNYASERTVVVPQQARQPTNTSPDTYSTEAAGTRENNMVLEEERKENERYRLRLRNARQSMMTINTISAPPAYEDSSYPPPPPPLPEKSAVRHLHPPSSSRNASDYAPTPGLPSGSGHHRNRRVTKASMMQNPWEQSGSGEEDDFGGKTLVETSPIRGGFGSSGKADYGKAAIYTLAPSSG